MKDNPRKKDDRKTVMVATRFNELEMKKLLEATELRGCRRSDIVREGALKYAERVIKYEKTRW